MLNSIRPQLAVPFVAGLLVCVPAVLWSSPQKSPSPPVKKAAPPNPMEARIAALEASSKKMAEAMESMATLSEKQGKALDEAELRLTRMEAQLADFVVAAKVDQALGALRKDLTALREQGEEIGRLKQSTVSLADDIERQRRSTNSLVDEFQKVNNLTEDLGRKVSSRDGSELERKIDSARDLARKCEDKIRDLERRDDKHDDRLSRLESKGTPNQR